MRCFFFLSTLQNNSLILYVFFLMKSNPTHTEEQIEVLGAREHNLKNINLTFPRNQLIVITGISGSGKSSLAFETLYAEGQRRYLESFSAYARSFIGLSLIHI